MSAKNFIKQSKLALFQVGNSKKKISTQKFFLVVMGAPNIKQFYPGKKSVISVDDFETPKDLALFLLELLEHKGITND
jgi:hypothetical protein